MILYIVKHFFGFYDRNFTMIDNIEYKIQNLRLQEYSLKNRSFWDLVISLETYMKQRQ